MPASPPRKRLQFHLSTAIVLTFVAGLLLWANIKTSQTSRLASTGTNAGADILQFTDRGWPLTAISSDADGNYLPGSGVVMIAGANVRPFAAGLNYLIAVAILLLVGYVCEWLIRRRAARGKA